MLKSREQITAEFISFIIPDLQLINTAYYLDNIKHHRMANIADIVNSATELYFLPHTLYFNGRCDYFLEENFPQIYFQMTFNHLDVLLNFYLKLGKQTFTIEIINDSFNFDNDNFEENTKKLQKAFNNALLSYQKKKALS